MDEGVGEFSIDTSLVGHLSLSGHFNIDLPTPEQSSKLRTIYNYASTIDPTVEPETILTQLEGRLGSPGLGESRLDRLYRWIKLKEQSISIDERLRNMEADTTAGSP